MISRQRILSGVLALFGVIYPGLVYYGTGVVPMRTFVMLALLVVGVRVIAQWREMSPFVGALAVVAVVQLALLPWDAPWVAKVYPVTMSLSFSAAFAWSLVRPPSLVERIAFLRSPQPPPEARPYLRRVTLVWALFLLANGMVSTWTAWLGDDFLWTLYNGLLSYLLMAGLMLGEWLLRQRLPQHRKGVSV